MARKRRYRRRYRRMRMRRYYRRRRGKTEVKHITIQSANPTPINNVLLSTPNTVLYRAATLNTVAGGFLGSISPGTGQGQRIGNSIFLKSISIHMTWYICPASTDTNEYSTAALRTILSTAPVYEGGPADWQYFFSGNSANHINTFINRDNTTVYLDHYSALNNGWAVAGNVRTGQGGIRRIRLTRNFNRNVTYNLGTNIPKNSRDILTLSNHAFSPNAADGTQIICTWYSVRIYYTDV